MLGLYAGQSRRLQSRDQWFSTVICCVEASEFVARVRRNVWGKYPHRQVTPFTGSSGGSYREILNKCILRGSRMY